MHAIRNLARIAFGRAAVRWSQLGFGRTSVDLDAQATAAKPVRFQGRHGQPQGRGPDGRRPSTSGTQAGDRRDGWLVGGSYLVARRINMTIETWDRQPLGEQEMVIGRTKAEGAPLSGGTEFTQPDFSITGGDDEPLIAHRLPTSAMVHPDNNSGVQMLRRGYNFVDGSDGLGRLDAGLFFIAYVRDPGTHYIPIQTKIGRADAMSEYIQHTGSALFAVPPGASQGEYVGQALFV